MFESRPRKQRNNLIKRKTVPSEGGRSTSGPVRFPSLPSTLRNRPRGTGESTIARLQRLVRDTPGCGVCGDKEVVSRTVDGETVYRCCHHIDCVKGFTGKVYTPSHVKGMVRYDIQTGRKEEL